jgi:prolyl 4-hydroxylase
MRLACNASGPFAATTVDAFFSKHAAAGELKPRVLSSAPWLLQLDDFVSRTAVDAMLQQVGRFRTAVVNTAQGYRSTLYRNSSQWGCMRCGKRAEHSAFLPYIDKVVTHLRLPRRQSSDLLVLRYGAGGYYRRHHDYLSPVTQPGLWHDRGPRQLTVMMYLSDSDEDAGGATRFYLQGSSSGQVVDVQPRVGRVLIWQNVRSRRPLEREDRTFHEARLLTAGSKHVVTSWFHAC